MKILYVEDEFAHVMLAERTLAESIQQEFRLIHAETIKRALQILGDQPDIDLVLSDLRLPDGTGLELLKKIRESKSPPAVVLVTGQGDQEVAVAALKAGAADYLVKQSDYLHRLPVVLSNAIAQNRLVREQEALRQAEIKYQSLVEQLPAVVFLDKADEEETPLYVSPRIKDLTGYAPEEWSISPKIWIQSLHPEDRARILARDKYSRQTGTPFLEEYRIVRKDGSIVWVKEDTKLICDSWGVQLYWQGILLDITNEKESLETLGKSEERFRRIFHASPIATCVTRLEDGRFIDANQSYLNLVGKPFGMLLTQTSSEMGLWKDEEERQIRITQLQKEGTLRGIDHQFVNIREGPRDTIAYYELIELGGQICVLAMFYDVTEEKRAQKDLQNERDFALLVLNNMGQGLTVTNKEGSYEYVNPAFARMLGYTSEEMMQRHPSAFTSEASKGGLVEEKALRNKGLITSYESTLLHRDSHEVPTLITGVPRWDDGSITGTIAVITDLTDRKSTEEALARQVKELTVLHSVATAAAEGQTEDEIIERVTHIIAQLYPEVCGVLLLNERATFLTPHPSNIGAQLPTWHDSYPVSTGITGRAVVLDRVICVSDVTEDAEYIEIASGIRSELAVPIRVNGRVIGVLNVESQKRAAFTESDERFLNTVASSMGTALERLRFLKRNKGIIVRPNCCVNLRRSWLLLWNSTHYSTQF